VKGTQNDNHVLEMSPPEQCRAVLAHRLTLPDPPARVLQQIPTNEDILGGNTTGQLRPLVLTEIRQADAVERNLQLIPNRTIVTSAHLQATNKLGASARDGVVSTDFKVGHRGVVRRRRKHFPHLHRRKSNAEHLYVCEDFCRQADSLSRELTPVDRPGAV
jgi:hypothetical protein